MQYTLTAELNGKSETLKFVAEDDADATVTAINYVMDSAYKKQRSAWAIGRITLVDANGVDVQEPMEAK